MYYTHFAERVRIIHPVYRATSQLFLLQTITNALYIRIDMLTIHVICKHLYTRISMYEFIHHCRSGIPQFYSFFNSIRKSNLLFFIILAQETSCSSHVCASCAKSQYHSVYKPDGTYYSAMLMNDTHTHTHSL